VPEQYRLRPATLEDVDALVRHRIGMFTDMGVPLDVEALDQAFRAWLAEMMPAGVYRAWLAEAVSATAAPTSASTVAGGGITILPWPPGPRYMGSRLAFVYNVYTEPAHRRRGLARSIMDAIHAWCLEAGITSVALNASADGRPLYEALGYQVSPQPMMFLPMVKV
jgi:GNAT superfamily N-acetyltransferase